MNAGLGGLRFVGGNSAARAKARMRLSKIAAQGIVLVGEVKPDLLTRIVLQDIDTLIKQGLRLDRTTLLFSKIMTCVRDAIPAEIRMSGKIITWEREYRLAVLNKILSSSSGSVDAGSSAVDKKISDAYSLYSLPVVVTTGGTINMAGATGRKAAGMVERLTGGGVISTLVFPEQQPALLNQPDSSNVGPPEWEKITLKVMEILARKMAARQLLQTHGYSLIDRPGGIILAHGTDTMEDTAAALALEFARRRTDITVVMTGSHSPADQPDSDANSNLLRAAHLAGDPNMPAGVYVLIGDDVHLGTRVKKFYTTPSEASRWSYFISLGDRVAGFTRRHQLVIDTAYMHWANTIRPKKIIKTPELTDHEYGYVNHVVVGKTSSPRILELALEDLRQRRGDKRQVAIVIQGDFSGNRRLGEMLAILKNLADDGILVCVGSRNSYNAVREIRGGIRGRLCLAPKHMLLSKIRTKLAWLLKYFSSARTEYLLEKNFAGELPDIPGFPEDLGHENYPDAANNLDECAVVVAFPGMTHNFLRQVIEELKAKIGEKKRRPEVVIYGFGDGHLPIGYNSIQEIFNLFFDGQLDSKLPHLVAIKKRLTDLKSYRRKASLNVANFAAGRPVNHSVIEGIEPGLFAVLQKEGVLDKNGVVDKKLPSKEIDLILPGFPLSHSQRKRLFELLSNAIKGNFPNILDLIKIALDRTLRVNEGDVLNLMAVYKIDEANLKRLLTAKALRGISQNDDDLRGRKIADIKSLGPEEALTTALSADYRGVFLEELAKRVIADVLSASSPMLQAVSFAVDAGICVRVKTRAFRSRVNLKNYELGNMLLAVGAQEDGSQTAFGYNVFRPK